MVLTMLSVPFEIDFLKLSQPLDRSLNLSLNHLIALPIPSLTDFAMLSQNLWNFSLCLYSITNPVIKAATPAITKTSGLATVKAKAALIPPATFVATGVSASSAFVAAFVLISAVHFNVFLTVAAFSLTRSICFLTALIPLAVLASPSVATS